MYEQFPEVMNMLWARMLRDNKKNWRRVYKVGHYTILLQRTTDTLFTLLIMTQSLIIPKSLEQMKFNNIFNN